MKRLLIALLSVAAAGVVGCEDENNDVLLEQDVEQGDIVYGSLFTKNGQCNPGDIVRCYSGQKSKVDVGICKAGYYECIYEQESGKWVWDTRECKGEVLPDLTYPCSVDNPEADFDCNGVPDNMQDEDGDGLTICSDEGFKDDMCDVRGGCEKRSATKSRRTNKLKALWTHDYAYTGNTQTVLLEEGTYRLEVWGAQGGGRNLPINNCDNFEHGGNGGLGGYAAGTITLTEETEVHINVGGAGSCATSGVALGGFNCGTQAGDCTGYASGSGEPGGGGGGATDIRIASNSLYSRVIVAGGGGGGGEDTGDQGGFGGGLTGVESDYTEYDATQTAAGLNGGFGRGASTGYGDGGGGGGGWYGGGTDKYPDMEAIGDDTEGGGGGSGYVYTADTASYYPEGCTLSNMHQMTSAMLLDGTQSMPSPDGYEEVGHSGNGFARISKLVESKGIDFDYTGSVQSYMLQPGSYKLEVWGAQGGHRNPDGQGYYYDCGQDRTGHGGYSVGTIRLKEPTMVYVRVGGQGNLGHCDIYSHICEGGFNGGGYRYMYHGGGGATDIRIGTDSLLSRVIVAGGGGSDGSDWCGGGAGGGWTGIESDPYDYYYPPYGDYDPFYVGDGGTQTGTPNPENVKSTQKISDLTHNIEDSNTYIENTDYFGGFGFGGAGLYNRGGFGGAGGGGWYGGNGVDPDCCGDDEKGGGGGSGYIYTKATKNNYPSGCLLNSNYYLLNADTVDGDSEFLDPDGFIEIGHTGNGFARITLVPDVEDEDEEDLEHTDFEYSGAPQSITLEPGRYRFQVWGAQGGYRNNTQKGGLGGYSEGVIELEETTTAYVRVGGAGNRGTCSGYICSGGFNGGGYRYQYKGGGGGTDIRLGIDSLYARVIVAGGGGSDGATGKPGAVGGGFNGGSATELYGSYGGGGTPTTSGGSTSYTTTTQPTSGLTDRAHVYGGFGFGGAGVYYADGYGGAGGGGWYGGNGAYPDGSIDDDRGGGGGSGFVFTESTRQYCPTGWVLSNKYYLNDTKVRSGESTFKAPEGGFEKGHRDDGYARITRLDKPANSVVSVQDFDYTGTAQHITLDPGEYRLEVWGAQGGDAGCYDTCTDVYGLSAPQSDCDCAKSLNAMGGKGGYSTGKLTLTEKTDAYVYVGGAGTDSKGIWVSLRFPTGNVNYPGGFNGGGDGNQDGMTGGGGASDIRLGTDSLYSRVIVAGGGGGGGNADSDGIHLSNGGHGGGLHGGTSDNATQFSNRVPGKGGTQIGITPAGSSSITAGFGRGGGGTGQNLRGGGGGGWYGGTQGDNSTGGGGGSGYVYTSSTAENYPAGGLLKPDYYLTEAYTMDGNLSFKAPDGSQEVGHSGNGHVRISKIGQEECHDYCVTYKDEYEISDTSCGLPNDSIVGVNPPKGQVPFKGNVYDPDYCGIPSNECWACSKLTPELIDIDGYGSFYIYHCDGTLYKSTIYRFMEFEQDFDLTYSDWGTSKLPVNKLVGASQLAKAMDICWEYDSSDPDSFGLIVDDSEVTKGDKDFTDPSSLPSLIASSQAAVKDGLRRQNGEIQVAPEGGLTFAMLSTGKATDAFETSSPTGSDGNCGYEETIPAVYANAHGSSLMTNPVCSNTGSYHCDAARLHLKLKAPKDAKGFSFEFRFFSLEYPHYVCTSFNDFFLALVTDEDGNAIVDTKDHDGNVAFDRNGNPITINSGFFTTCYAPECNGSMMSSTIDGCPANYGGCTDGHCGVCEDGVEDLYGFMRSPYTGSSGSQGGATAWLTTFVPISPGQVFNLDFFIWDTGDHGWDSSVIIDNFKWRTKATEVGTFITGSGEIVE